MRFLTWLAAYVAGVAAAAWLFDGIRFAGPGQGSAELSEKWLPLLIVALILGVVSAIVKPVVKLVSLPLILLTLGLFLFVINALMLMLTGWLAAVADLGFTVDGFWVALGGSIVITIVTWGVEAAFGDD